MHARARGVTLVELMVVVAVVAILSAFFISRFAESRRDAVDARALNLLSQLRTAVVQFEARTGAFPAQVMTTPATHWDLWVAQVEAGLGGSLQFPRWAQVSALITAAEFSAGGFGGDPYGMGLAPAGGRGVWFRATPFVAMRCPAPAAWSTTGCAIVQ